MDAAIFVKCRDFAKMSCFVMYLPKCHGFTFLQEFFVFNQHKLKFIVKFYNTVTLLETHVF